jgi:chromosome partitioning protein
MKTITLASGKGGSGRSTTALALAVHTHLENRRVALIDLDPGQGVVQRWFALREKEGPELVTPDANHKLHVELKRLADAGTQFVFIDTEPAVDKDRVTEAAIKACDLCLIPVRPSFFDVTSIGAVVEMCEERGKPYRTLLVDVDDHTAQWKKLVDAAAVALRTKPPTLLNSRLAHRVPYVNALTKGMTGGEINKDARGETHMLWAEILNVLEAARD